MKSAILLLTAFVSGCAGYPLLEWRDDIELASNKGLTVYPVPTNDVPGECRRISKRELGKESTFHRGCAVVKGLECWLIYQQPKDWYEKSKLAVIGEEFLHCVGYQH